MSCCEQPIGLAHLADESWVVSIAYISAFLPWTVLYAFDFISAKWKTVRRTRHSGLLHLSVSLPPVLYIIFYAHLQRISGDYKEMWTAITAAVLCLFNVIRTLWGLLQLYAFSVWSNRALNTLKRMGYHNDKVADEKSIDRDMLVNNSLIDNEFGDTELPVIPVIKEEWNKAPYESLKSMWRSIVSRRYETLLYCTRPSECCTRWLAAFLCKFGGGWLKDCKMEHPKFSSLRLRMSRNTAVKGFLHVTVTSEDANKRKDLYSVMSPTNLVQLYLYNGKILQELSKEVFPYSHHRREEHDEAPHFLCLERFNPTLRHSIAIWDPKDLNKLDDDERAAVEHMTAFQLETFVTLMHEDSEEWAKYENGKRNMKFLDDFTDECVPVAVILDQLGFSSTYSIKDVVDGIPLREELCKPFLWDLEPNKSLLQASLHIDNITALKFGGSLKKWNQFEEKMNIKPTEEAIFEEQKLLTIQLLQGILAESHHFQDLTFPTSRFIGCIAETVRSLLGEWLVRTSRSGKRCNWKPLISQIAEPFTFLGSNQLIESLRNMKERQCNDKDNGEADCRVEGIYLRLLWECQYSLQCKSVRDMEEAEYNVELMSSMHIIMLFTLGFPAINIQQVKNSRTVAKRDAADTAEVDEEVGECGNDDDESYVQFLIEPVLAPEKLKLSLSCNIETKECKISLELHSNSTIEFNWQEWKDSIMGRIYGHSVWLDTRGSKTPNWFRTGAGKSTISNPMLNIQQKYTQLEYGVLYWSGWPPFYTKIARFEVIHSAKLLPNRLYAEPNYYLALSDSELLEALLRLEDGLKVVGQIEAPHSRRVLMEHQKIAVENENQSEATTISIDTLNPDERLLFPEWTISLRTSDGLEQHLNVQNSMERDDIEDSSRLLFRLFKQKHKISYLKELVDHLLFPDNPVQRHVRQLVLDMKEILFSIYQEIQHGMDEESRKNATNYRRDLGNYALKIARETGDAEAHLLYCQTLFHEATPESNQDRKSKSTKEVPEAAICAFENLLAQLDKETNDHFHLHLYLAASFMYNFMVSKKPFSDMLGIQHLERVMNKNSSDPNMSVLLDGRSLDGRIDAVLSKAEEDTRDPLLVRILREVLFKIAPTDAERSASNKKFFKDFDGIV